MEVFVFLKRCLLVFAFVGTLCVLSPRAAAQSNNSCLAITTWWFPLSIPTGWSYYGEYPGTYTYLIWAWNATCPPPPPCPCSIAPGGSPAHTAGSPISLATGNTYIEQKDIRIPGLAGGLNLVRRWNSTWPASQSALQVGLFGPNWRSTYEEQVFVGSDNYIKYMRGDGSFWSFGTDSNAPGSWAPAAPQNVSALLTTPSTATPYWTITFQNGEQRRFDGTSGMLTAIIDRNGNTTTLTYDGANRLATIVDPVSRHLNFTYGSPSSHLVTGVSSDVGISLTYAYDGQSRLSQITNPDSTTISFGYDSQSRIISVTDMNGKILESHTYDSNGRGLTSSRAAGVDSDFWRQVLMRVNNWKLIPILTILLLFFVAPGAHAAPTITSLSVSSGPVGTAVTITGTNFGSTQGTSTVKFNGTTASVTSWSATSIGVTVPSAATTGNVVVTVSNVASNGKSFTVTPAITSLSISTGAVGAAVTITGTTFGSTQGTSTAKFNGTTATVTSWGASSIAVTVPSGATTGNVVVTVSSQPSNGVNFTVVPAPSITSLSITTGAVGAAVTITGSNFGSTQGTSTVKFHGTTASPTSWSATSIAVSVPSGATTGTVVVHASGVDSNGVNFTIVPAPSITSLSVITGAVGTAVTVTGSNFGSSQGTGTVTFNGTTASVTTWGASSIAVTVPNGATTGNVVVNTSGVASNGKSFTVTPAITSLSISTGAVGAAVTITGTTFGSTQGTSTAKFNGTTATVTSWGASSIAVTVPSGATTGNVVVTVSSQPSNGVNFTVVPAPSITSLSVTTGAVGAAVTVTGSNFGSTQG